MKVTTAGTLWLPSAADGVDVTPSGTAYTFSAWVAVTTSAPTDLYATRLRVHPRDANTYGKRMTELQVGVGASGSEVPVVTLRVTFDTQQAGPQGSIPFGLMYNLIASGSRVSVRLRHSLTSDTNLYRVALGYQASLGGNTVYTTGVQDVTPTGSSTVTSTTPGTTAWLNGGWATIMTTIANPRRLTGVAVNTGDELEVDFGIGSVAFATIAYAERSTGVQYVRLSHPITIPTGTTLQVRVRANSVSAVGYAVYVWFSEE